jgi:hypothetical protein
VWSATPGRPLRVAGNSPFEKTPLQAFQFPEPSALVQPLRPF